MQLRQFKAALFDLDGVVFDTEPQYTIFWGMICRQYHPEHPGLEHEIKGSTLTQIYDRWLSGPLEKERAVSMPMSSRCIMISLLASRN